MKALPFLFIFFLLSLIGLSAEAQKNIFGLPEIIPQPSWYQKVDWAKPNLFQIDSLIKSFTSNQIKKRKLPEAKSFEPEFEEDPYTTAYIRWKMERLPFLQPDGSILYDPNYYLNKCAASSHLQRSVNQGNWTPLGPIETFRSSTAEKTNSQCNIISVAISTFQPNTIYAGSETGVLFLSLIHI